MKNIMRVIKNWTIAIRVKYVLWRADRVLAKVYQQRLKQLHAPVKKSQKTS